MISRIDIYKLFELKNLVRSEFSEFAVDIRKYAGNLDLDKVMKEIIHICETEDYFAGSHMFCTRENVIPRYKKDKSLVLDADHIEGLCKLLLIHKKIIKDY